MSPHPSLSIGAVAGGPGTNREWAEAVKELGRQVAVLREGVDSPLAVNVVFQIPGQYLQPDFKGIRSGRFSRKEARLLVQVALPGAPSPSPQIDVRRLLGEAVLVAEEFARQEGMIDGQLVELRGLLQRL